MIVIGDVHGCYKTLMALIDKLPEKHNLCFVGDLIDRGADSKKVVDFIIENNHKCVLGNHEDFLIHSFNDTSKNAYVYINWISNGGDTTLKSYSNDIEKLCEWVKTLPLFIEYSGQNKKFIISHSYCGEYWLNKDTYTEQFRQETLWGRSFKGDLDGAVNIIGHTPVQFVVSRKDYIIIDTGCVFGHSLSAIDLDTGMIYQQKNIEN